MLCVREDTFELEGFEIMTEVGGRDGLAKAVGWQLDIILLDIIMDEKENERDKSQKTAKKLWSLDRAG